MWNTRVTGTKHLVNGILEHGKQVTAFISASAIGFYDHQDQGKRTEDSPPGKGFMAELCKAWENEALTIQKKSSIREIRLRIGVVIGPDGGALTSMKPPFEWGVGGRLGHGKQWMNWIHRDDLIALIIAAIQNRDYSGVYNAVSPKNSSNQTFSSTLASLLKRPNLFAVPKIALKIALGEMADVVLNGANIVPDKLSKSGFSFQFPDLTLALKDALHIKFIRHLNKEIACDRFYAQQWLKQEKKQCFHVLFGCKKSRGHYAINT